MEAVRRVRRVSLRAPSDALARRGAILLEDALRTATLPSARRGRVLVFRRLDVGRIDPSQSPATLAIAIERRVAEAVADVVPASSARAESALGVSFADEVEPFVMLAVAAARGAPRSAWFWALAVRGARADASDAETIALCLRASMETPLGATAAAHVVRALLDRGLIAPLVRATASTRARDLFQLARWREPSPSSRARPAVDPVMVPPTARALIEAVIARFGPRDARSTWLAAMAIAAARLPALVTAGLVELGTRVVDEIDVSVRAARAPQAVDPEIEASRARDAAEAATDESREHASPRASDVTERAPPSRGDGAPESAPVDRRRDVDAPETEAWPEPAPLERTAIGGLLFVVPLLERAGIVDRIERAAAPVDLAQRFLADLALRLGAPSDDALVKVFSLDRDDAASNLDDELRSLRIAVRRLARRGARIGLHPLVVRPARVASTPTHIDLFFRHDQVELRIRRAGLDIDPGWVPWLGRVIRYHYVAAEELL